MEVIILLFVSTLFLNDLFIYFSISEYYEYGHGTNDEAYNNYGKSVTHLTYFIHTVLMP